MSLAGAIAVLGLTVGSPAPKFSCASHTGATVSLGDYAHKQLCLWFYPRASTAQLFSSTSSSATLRSPHQATISALHARIYRAGVFKQLLIGPNSYTKQTHTTIIKLYKKQVSV